jgi:formylglycine-generating enzyme required for sulfatase activity
VSFVSAMAYTKSRGCRLPTEEEWAAVASGPQKLIYPWGDTWEPNRANDREAGVGGLRPVGSYPDGRGPFGHYDLAGNAREWTMTYESGKPVDPEKIEDQNVALRGGSWTCGKDNVTVGWVWLNRFNAQDLETGFRLAMDQEATAPQNPPDK